MEQDVHTSYSSVCSTCLSTDRFVYCINESHTVYQMYRLLMHDFEADRFGDTVQMQETVCWECLALLKKFGRFKNQVHSAQEHLRILAMSRTQETMDHTYMSQSLSSLEATTKAEYDKIYLYYTQDEWPQPFVVNEEVVKSEQFDVAQVVRNNLQLNIDNHLLEVPELVLENPVTGAMSRIVVGTTAALVSPEDATKQDLMPVESSVEVLTHTKIKTTDELDYGDCMPGTELLSTMEMPKIIKKPQPNIITNKSDYSKSQGYLTDFMTEAELMTMRAELKNKIQYVSSSYKCELCIIGFYTQQQVEDHFLSDHRAKPGKSACQVCYTYIQDSKLAEHTDAHFLRYTCKLCGHQEYSEKIISMHVKQHMDAQLPNAVIRIGTSTGKIIQFHWLSDFCSKLAEHTDAHFLRYTCKLCGHQEYSEKIISMHVKQHMDAQLPNAVIRIGTSTGKSIKFHWLSGFGSKLAEHTDAHFLRYTCKLCGHQEYSEKIISMHVKQHMDAQLPNAVIRIGTSTGKSKKKAPQPPTKPPPKPGDLRKLLSKTTIEGYQCLECDMFFKNSRVRKTHVLRCHREGFQCDHCKKRFVNKTTLATHLRLHEGPLPREECPICHKMVRVIQLKYHIRRHQNKNRYHCVECDKTFSHLASYQGHLKYSRAHASESVFKFPCPMCNKGYPTKEAMQDHFNYQHLGKTSHKCPVCDKPIASRANVEKHLMRMHGQRKEKPRNHVCSVCGKAFTDKKALNQHEVIHSGERPLTCDICQQTFKQKASLYTHRIVRLRRMIQRCPGGLKRQD